METKLAAIKEAGFDGITALLDAKHGPVTDGNGRLSVEFNQWRPFLEKTLETWLSGKPGNTTVFVCPEMGPVGGGYNFAQLPSSWEDAKVLRVIIDKTWKKTLSNLKKA